MKKQLLFIIDWLRLGGAEKSLISLLPLIDYSHYDVDLLIFKRGGIYEKYLPKEVNIIDYELFGSSMAGTIGNFVFDALLSLKFKLYPKRHGAEIYWRTVHSQFKPLTKVYNAAIAYQQGTPTFFLATKVKADKKLAWVNADIFKAGYDMNYCKSFYEKIDHVVAVSDKLAGLLQTKLPWITDRLACIYDILNPVLIKELSKESIQDMARQGEEYIFVTVGRLSQPKNHMLAVDAALVLKQRGLSFKWYFIGGGELKSAIEKKIHDNHLTDHVTLLGTKENPYPYIANADVYIQSSSFEGFGLTIAEAKILHKPIVSTNFDVVHDQIEDHKNGIIVGMNPESLADGIIELINGESLRQSIINNLEHEKNTTMETEISKLYQLIDN